MADPERKLAAILSADVVGYSRLMAEDEAETVTRATPSGLDVYSAGFGPGARCRSRLEKKDRRRGLLPASVMSPALSPSLQ